MVSLGERQVTLLSGPTEGSRLVLATKLHADGQEEYSPIGSYGESRAYMDVSSYEGWKCEGALRWEGPDGDWRERSTARHGGADAYEIVSTQYGPAIMYGIDMGSLSRDDNLEALGLGREDTRKLYRDGWRVATAKGVAFGPVTLGPESLADTTPLDSSVDWSNQDALKPSCFRAKDDGKHEQGLLYAVSPNDPSDIVQITPNIDELTATVKVEGTQGSASWTQVDRDRPPVSFAEIHRSTDENPKDKCWITKMAIKETPASLYRKRLESQQSASSGIRPASETDDGTVLVGFYAADPKEVDSVQMESLDEDTLAEVKTQQAEGRQVFSASALVVGPGFGRTWAEFYDRSSES